MQKHKLELSNVSFSYRNAKTEKNVLEDFSLTLHEKERVCLFGPSGCGKSTVLRLAMGLETLQEGTLTNDFFAIAPVFQEDRLIDGYSLLKNVRFSGGAYAQEILASVGLAAYEKKRPPQLSGGQKRRAALCRALNMDSDLLVLDEPFNGLDEKSVLLCVEAIERWAGDRAMLIVSHSQEHAALLHARIVHMDAPSEKKA